MKINLQGKELEIVEVDFETHREEWNEYRLLDGGVVRVKLAILHVYRVLDEEGKPSSNRDGTPNFVVTSSTLVATKE